VSALRGKGANWPRTVETMWQGRGNGENANGVGKLQSESGANANVISALEGELGVALLDLYQKWRKIHYYNLRFKEMVTKTRHIRFYKGPVDTVRHLLLGETSDMFRFLVQANRIE
jgi:hypothetical protein